MGVCNACALCGDLFRNRAGRGEVSAAAAAKGAAAVGERAVQIGTGEASVDDRLLHGLPEALEIVGTGGKIAGMIHKKHLQTNRTGGERRGNPPVLHVSCGHFWNVRLETHGTQDACTSPQPAGAAVISEEAARECCVNARNCWSASWKETVRNLCSDETVASNDDGCIIPEECDCLVKIRGNFSEKVRRCPPLWHRGICLEISKKSLHCRTNYGIIKNVMSFPGRQFFVRRKRKIR